MKFYLANKLSLKESELAKNNKIIPINHKPAYKTSCFLVGLLFQFGLLGFILFLLKRLSIPKYPLPLHKPLQ